MSDLPLLVLSKISDFLDIRDKLNTKVTCKKWKLAIETISVQRSVCVYWNEYPYHEKWCFSDQNVLEEEMVFAKIDNEHFVECDYEKRLPCKFVRKLNFEMDFFKSLQKICPYYIGGQLDDYLPEISSLTQLKVLMICEKKLEFYGTFSSASLEKLSLKCLEFERFSKSGLNTPNLNSFLLWENAFFHSDHRVYYRNRARQPITFRYPLAIKHLQCFLFSSEFEKLKNLETVVCQQITFNFKLEDFKLLTRLEVFPVHERQLSVIQRIREEQRLLRRDRLDLTVCGFREELILCERSKYSRSLRQVQLSASFLELLAKNSAQFARKICWEFVLTVDFSKAAWQSIPRQIQVYQITIGSSLPEAKDRFIPSYLVQFIRERAVASVQIQGTPWTLSCLKKNFYEQLSTVQSIKYLQKDEPLEDLEADVLLNFLNLSNLISLSVITEKFYTHFVCMAFTKLKFFSDLHFQGNRTLKLWDMFGLRSSNQRFSFKVGYKKEFFFLSQYLPYSLQVSYQKKYALMKKDFEHEEINGLIQDFREWKESLE